MPDRSSNTTSRLAARLQRRREAIRQRPRLYAAIAVIVVAFFAALAWPFTIAHLQSIAVLDLVGGKPVPPLLHRLVTEPFTTRDLTLPLPSGPVRARLYTPTRIANPPSVVVLHGVHHLGIDEPRMIAFASAMASCGIRVAHPRAARHQGLPRRRQLHRHHRRLRRLALAAVQRKTRRRHGPQLLRRTRPPRHRRPHLAAAHQVRRRHRLAGRDVPRRRLLPHRHRPAPRRQRRDPHPT